MRLKDALASFPMQHVIGGEVAHGQALIAEAYGTANGRVNSLEVSPDSSRRGSGRFNEDVRTIAGLKQFSQIW